MRPIKLTMQAFGPYKGEEVIDFQRLGQRNLFLITGTTGAGKTSIFDAIAYALYGEASSSDRDFKNLISDFEQVYGELAPYNTASNAFPPRKRKSKGGKVTPPKLPPPNFTAFQTPKGPP